MSSQQQQIPSNLLEKDNRSETTIQSDRQTIHDASSIKDAPPANKPSSSSPKAWYKSIFTGPSSGDDPRNYSRRKKTFILMVVSIAGSISPFASTIYYPALVDMQYAFQTSDTAMNASLSVFTFVTAFFPLIWAAFGDAFGRRRIYLISFLISVIGSICCAVSVNVTMFIVFRAFSGIGSSSVMSMGAGTIGDIFEAHERGRAFSYYTIGPLLGPALAPIIGGYLNQGLGWRSNFWFLAIFAFCIWVAILLILPETRQRNQEEKEKKRKMVNPLMALQLLKHFNIALTVTFIAILFFTFYLVNTNFTRTYETQYGLDSGTVGLCYLPMAAGSIVGGLVGGRFSDKVYNRRVAKAENQHTYPEMRLGGWLFYGGVLTQLAALVVYGWCIRYNVHYSVGLVCLFFAGLGLMVPNVTLSAYLVDCFRKQSASVTACNNFVRYIMAGVGSLVSSDLERALGSGILYTVCGGALLLCTTNIIIIRIRGKKWAAKQKQEEQGAA